MKLLFRLLPAVMMLPAGVYFYFFFKRAAGFFRVDTENKWVKAILLTATGAVVAFCSNARNAGMIIALHVLIFALIMELLNGIAKRLLRKAKRADSIWKKVYRCGLVPLFSAAIVMGYGYWNITNVVEKQYTVYTNKEIREEGYRIAVISDLHYGLTMDAEELREYCEEIGRQDPDLVVLCGDIVDEQTGLTRMREVFSLLGGIESRYGVFFVYGNHDRSRYTDDPAFTEIQLQEELDSAGIQILQDESYALNEEFILIGKEDISLAGQDGRKTNEELLEDVNRNAFLLLLDHQPAGLSANSRAGYDLQLSGHTHKGQIWPAGLISEWLGIGDLNYGYEKIGDFQVIVSSGMAGWGYPIRTSGHSEYLMVTVLNGTVGND